jgi:hypothetical protein
MIKLVVMVEVETDNPAFESEEPPPDIDALLIATVQGAKVCRAISVMEPEEARQMLCAHMIAMEAIAQTQGGGPNGPLH